MDTQNNQRDQKIDEQQSSTQSPQSVKISKRRAVTAGVVLFIILAALASAFYYNSIAGKKVTPLPIPNQNNNGTAATSSPDSSVVPSTPDATSTTEVCQKYTPPTRELAGDIVWQKPVVISPLDIFDKKSQSADFITQNSKFWLVGQVVNGKYQGYEAVLADIAQEGMVFYPSYFRFFRQDGKIVMLGKYSPESSEYDGLDNSRFARDNNYLVSDLDFPESFQGSTNRENFKLDQYATFAFCSKGLTKQFHHAILGDVYTTSEQSSSDGVGIQRNESSFGFYLVSPDGTAIVYTLVIDFINAKNIPQVSWVDGSKNTEEYTYTDIGGCGSRNYLSVIAPDRVNPATDLVEAGVNSFGDKIYALKDPNHPLLKDIYDHQYFVYDGEKIPYEQFVKSHPVFFWYDPFGRLIKFQNNKFIPQAECAKPVIYLYPQTEQAVSVKLNPAGGFSFTEPAYNEGWSVIASPDGSLIESISGKSYPYLFWEGRGGIYPTSADKGFVISKDQVHSFLVEKLALLGLNVKESKDFIDFWEPRMQASPYYFVTFYGKSLMDYLAPLSISPKPDTVIRVLMDFKPLQEPIEVQEYKILPPLRKGFTVVEWGGVLR